MGVPAADTALFEAVKSNDLQQVQSALSSGANVNARDDAGLSPLIHAVKADNIGIVSLLVENGADLTVNYGEPDDPLHLFHYANCGSSRSETGIQIHQFLWRSFRENVLQKRPLTAQETHALLDAHSDVDGHAAFRSKDGALYEGYYSVDEHSDGIRFIWAPSPLTYPASDDFSEELIPFEDIDLESLYW